MKIISLVLKFLPEHAAAIAAGVAQVAGASVAMDNGDGRMIVLIEDGDNYSTADSIIEVHQVPHIMSVTLAYEYTDDDLPAPLPLDAPNFAALQAPPDTATNSGAHAELQAADALATHLEKLEA